MRKVEKIRIKSGTLKGNQYNMVETSQGYVPRDPSYPLTGAGKHAKASCEKVVKK